MLNKLQIDILKRHVGPFVFCFFTVMFLLLMQFLMLYIDKLVGKGLPFDIIIELIITNLAAMVVLAAPMAVLVASLMAYGKFTELNELTALRAAGVNPIHIINPVLGAATILTISLVLFGNYVLPDSNQRARS
ncbi:MAG: LptF/LptG family permease, partial [Candidatus Halalkalibacterium sp. M3_1C_030]